MDCPVESGPLLDAWPKREVPPPDCDQAVTDFQSKNERGSMRDDGPPAHAADHHACLSMDLIQHRKINDRSKGACLGSARK
jgi:hypothetical protein